MIRSLLIRTATQGKLTDGTVFDSSHNRGEPFTFTLGVGQVIKGTHDSWAIQQTTNPLSHPRSWPSLCYTGWDKGLVGMCVGEKRRLRIPSDMAYGKSGSPPTIPPDAPLIFEVEFVNIL